MCHLRFFKKHRTCELQKIFWTCNTKTLRLISRFVNSFKCLRVIILIPGSLQIIYLSLQMGESQQRWGWSQFGQSLLSVSESVLANFCIDSMSVLSLIRIWIMWGTKELYFLSLLSVRLSSIHCVHHYGFNFLSLWPAKPLLQIDSMLWF